MLLYVLLITLLSVEVTVKLTVSIPHLSHDMYKKVNRNFTHFKLYTERHIFCFKIQS